MRLRKRREGRIAPALSALEKNSRQLNGQDMELGTGADYGRIEYAYSLMAGSVGINISPCRLLEENNRAHFMTKRFEVKS
jgi:hypothetical protein